MDEFFYRQKDGESRRIVGPYATADEARKAARYKGLLSIEVLRKSGAGYETIEASASAPMAKTG